MEKCDAEADPKHRTYPSLLGCCWQDRRNCFADDNTEVIRQKNSCSHTCAEISWYRISGTALVAEELVSGLRPVYLPLYGQALDLVGLQWKIAIALLIKVIVDC